MENRLFNDNSTLKDQVSYDNTTGIETHYKFNKDGTISVSMYRDGNRIYGFVMKSIETPDSDPEYLAGTGIILEGTIKIGPFEVDVTLTQGIKNGKYTINFGADGKIASITNGQQEVNILTKGSIEMALAVAKLTFGVNAQIKCSLSFPGVFRQMDIVLVVLLLLRRSFLVKQQIKLLRYL